MIDGGIESHIVDPEMPSLEDGAVTAEPNERPSPRPSDNMWQKRRRQRSNRSGSPPNILLVSVMMIETKEVNNAQRERGLLGLNNDPRGRGLLGPNNIPRCKEASFSH